MGPRLTSKRGFLCYRSPAGPLLTTADVSQAPPWGYRVGDGASQSKPWERPQTFKGRGAEGEDEGVERAWLRKESGDPVRRRLACEEYGASLKDILRRNKRALTRRNVFSVAESDTAELADLKSPLVLKSPPR